MKQLDEIGHDEAFAVYGAYSKLLNDARLCAVKQTGYRILASTWFLATLAGAGFLISANNVLPFSHLLGVAIICFIGAGGQYILWYEDTIVEEQLLDLSVIEALHLESEHGWLPRLHHRFLHLYSGSTSIVKTLFFIGCKSLLVFVSALCLGFYFYPAKLEAAISFVALIVLNFFSSRFMKSKSEVVKDLELFIREKRAGRG